MNKQSDYPFRYAPDPGLAITLLDSSPPPWTFSSLLAPFHFITSQIFAPFTGTVYKPLVPNSLRLIWYLHNGKEHSRDYDLFHYPVVGENYDILCEHEEVRRVVVMGYSNQNPWAEEGNGMDAKLRKIKAEAKRAKIAQEKSERKDEGAEGRDTNCNGDKKTKISIEGDDLSDAAVASRERAGEEQEGAETCWEDLLRERS